MADRNLGALPAVTALGMTDTLLLEQGGQAMQMSGLQLRNALAAWLDGHGGIKSWEKTKTEGLVDTYTVTLADGTAVEYTVKNGNDLTKLEKVSTEGLVDTYHFTRSDGTVFPFTVTNGAKGDAPVVTASRDGKVTTIKADGVDIATINDGDDGFSPTVTILPVAVAPGAPAKKSICITDAQGDHFYTVTDGADGAPGVKGDSGTPGSSVDAEVSDLAATEEHPNGGVQLTITKTAYSASGQASTSSSVVQLWNGKDGYAPVIAASKEKRTTTITVDGVPIATINDGVDGTGAGDMVKETYDPNDHAEDIFAYADSKAGAVQDDLNTHKANTGIHVTAEEKAAWNGKAEPEDIPTQLSELSGDATHRLVTDAEKTAWNGKAEPDDIPTQLSELSDDATHRLVTDTEKAAWNNKVNKSSDVYVTLLASGWTGDAAPFLYTAAVQGVTTTSVQDWYDDPDMTLEQLDAWQDARVVNGGQSANTVIFRAWGDKPTVDIPLRCILRKDL